MFGPLFYNQLVLENLILFHKVDLAAKDKISESYGSYASSFRMPGWSRTSSVVLTPKLSGHRLSPKRPAQNPFNFIAPCNGVIMIISILTIPISMIYKLIRYYHQTVWFPPGFSI